MSARDDKDLRDIDEQIDSLAMQIPTDWGDDEEITKIEAPPKSSVPPGVKSLVAVLELLPPNTRIVGLALILAALGAFVAWKGGAF